ncbi:immunoglobulin alpha-2 heavy chain-like [Hoplias malabaricus]|uniref:immunoglobulin alpha-2 heavy chain-like n=1 Tax=Hoplias malabaricus TaxID=27720 RepID=UPI00346356D4
MGPFQHVLLFFCTYTFRTSLSSMLLQSPEVVHVSVGDTFTLNCVHEFKVKYCYSTTTWHKVNPRTLKLTEVRSSIPDLNKQTADTKMCSLTVSKATLQDSGIYYCAAGYHLMGLVGNGSTVIVTNPGPLELSIVPFWPLDVSSSSVPLQCLVMGAVPSQVQIVWMIDDRKRSGWTESSWTQDSDSALEFTRARITLSQAEFKQAAQIECVVGYGNRSLSTTLRPRGNYQHDITYTAMFGALFFLTIVVVTFTACLLRGRKDTPMPSGQSSAWTVVEYSCCDQRCDQITNAESGLNYPFKLCKRSLRKESSHF